MGFNCGIVGLPNVGKSTLFNALTATQAAEAANFPFCTKEPNVGRVGVPDPRLDKIAAIAKSAKIIPTQLEFVDIAGLIRGASKGEGLGNQFLGNIREVDAIVHVLRCFEDDDITHVEGGIDPIRDAETVETELMLADMDGLERRLNAMQKKAKGGDKEAKASADMMERALAVLQAGKPARTLESPTTSCRCSIAAAADRQAGALRLQRRGRFGRHGQRAVRQGCRDGEGAGRRQRHRLRRHRVGGGAASDEAEKKEFLETLGLEEPGLNRVIRAGYELLDLITFFTVGPKEARAWTVHAMPRLRKRPASSTATSSAASSGRKQSIITALSHLAANKPQKKPGRCGRKAKNTSFRTAIFSTSASTSKALCL